MPNPMVSNEYKIYIVVYIITVKSDLLWSEWTLSGQSWAMLDVKKKADMTTYWLPSKILSVITS